MIGAVNILSKSKKGLGIYPNPFLSIKDEVFSYDDVVDVNQLFYNHQKYMIILFVSKIHNNHFHHLQNAI
jgi:hypothetical protein